MNMQRENKNRPPHKKAVETTRGSKHAPSPHGDESGGHHKGAHHVPPHHVDETPPEISPDVWPDPDYPAPGRAPSEELQSEDHE